MSLVAMLLLVGQIPQMGWSRSSKEWEMLTSAITIESDIPGEMTCAEYGRMCALVRPPARGIRMMLLEVRKVFWMSERELVMNHVWGRLVRAWADERHDDARALERTYAGYEGMTNAEYEMATDSDAEAVEV